MLDLPNDSGHFNILDELLSEEEYLEGVTWLKDYQHLTKCIASYIHYLLH